MIVTTTPSIEGKPIHEYLGVVSGIGLVITGEFQSNGILNGGLLSPSPSLLGELAIGGATEDYFFGENVYQAMGLLLHGLDPALSYDLRFFSTRDTATNQVTRFHVRGRSLAVGDLQTSGLGIGSTGGNGNDDEILTLRRLQADPFGRLFVDVEKIDGNFGYVGALELIVRPPRPVLEEHGRTGL